MNRERFWNILEKSKPQDDHDCLIHLENIRAELDALPAAEAASFQCHVDELLSESYDAALWNIVFAMLGGCSDDSFDYFRGWLMLQGKEVFYKSLENPEWLGQYVDRTKLHKGIVCEELLGLARVVYHDKTGSWDMPETEKQAAQLRGVLLEEAELKSRYRPLWDHFRSLERDCTF